MFWTVVGCDAKGVCKKGATHFPVQEAVYENSHWFQIFAWFSCQADVQSIGLPVTIIIWESKFALHVSKHVLYFALHSF